MPRRVRGARTVKRGLVNGLVYPLPHTHSLGTHLSKTVHGNVTLGPTARFQQRKDDYESDRLPSNRFSSRRGACCHRCNCRTCGSAPPASVPNCTARKPAFADFMIGRDEKCPRLVQAAGIESPGLTACLAIGEQVARLVDEILD